MKENKNQIQVGSLMDRIGENSTGGRLLETMCFELNVAWDGPAHQLQVSGGRVQSHGIMTEKAYLPRAIRTYGMDRTDESDDLVDRKWDGNKRLLWYVGNWIWRFLYVRRQFVIDASFDCQCNWVSVWSDQVLMCLYWHESVYFAKLLWNIYPMSSTKCF